MAGCTSVEGQAAQIQQLTHLIKDVQRQNHGPEDLVKWLKANNFDVKKAAEMYRTSMQWRKDNDVDHLLENFTIPEVLQKYYPGGSPIGVDRQGRPLILDMIGRADMQGILNSVRYSDILWFMVHKCELLDKNFQELSQQSGHRIDQCVQIIDMEGFGTKHLCKAVLNLYIEILRLLCKHYPENLAQTFIINAPRIFQMVYDMFKSFIDENLVQKFIILGSDWQTRVFQDVDPSQLPTFHGGTKLDSDGDAMCRSLINYGGEVPKSYYHSSQFNAEEEDKDSDMAQVKRGSVLQIAFEIIEPNSILRWKFRTKDHAIKFGVFRKTSTEKTKLEEMEAMVALQTINCHMVPEEGSLLCQSPGIYVIAFDNRQNWLTRRTVLYSVDIAKIDMKENGIFETHIKQTGVMDSDMEITRV